MAEYIRVASPSFLGNERRYVNDCLDHLELSWHGPYVKRFETEFAKFCESAHALTCCNGTAALHLALLGAGVSAGDDVFVPALTYVATANAVKYIGANPIFCDVNRQSWNLDVEQVCAKWRAAKRPRCIVPVHLYGVPAQMTELMQFAAQKELLVVEDAAEAHGAECDYHRVGSVSHASAFSFFANKILTTGEGGMVTTNDEDVADHIRLYRGQGQGDKPYYHPIVGYNYRMTNIQAAIGLAQLETYSRHLTQRAKVWEMYRQHLGEFEQQEIAANLRPSWWMFTVLVPKGVNRDGVRERMKQADVETRPIFMPLTDLPPYKHVTPPHTADIASRGINLPTHGQLSHKDILRVIEEFKRAVQV